MNILKLTLSYIRQNKLGTALNVLLLGLGMATIVVLLLFSKQLDDNLQSNVKGIDLVVGAKGSPLQLILSSVFHIDTPPGNIPVREARELSMHPMVAETIPLALGDSYEQYRIVGSTPALLDHYEVAVVQGASWSSAFEVVVGSQVAEEEGLTIGDTIVSAHGIGGGNAHGDHPLRVVGILGSAGSVIDRLVVTSIETVWAMHGLHSAEEDAHDEHDEEDSHDHEESESDHHDEDVMASDENLEYTTLLVKYKTPIAAATLPRYINKETSMQAAAPVFQTARLLSLLGTGIDAFRVFAYVLIFAASLGVFIALYNAMKERAYDLAIMRTMGASRGFLLKQVILEGVLLALLGTLFGLILGHGAAELLGTFVGESRGLDISGFFFSIDELWLVALAIVIGVIASVLPAIQAYRTDIARTLSQS
ncbi:MAG: FtsX-like permease family protein [Rhodothermaceae bacterium]|nr:FtsX-like permease family protein [Rhodothermaceae bacterium]